MTTLLATHQTLERWLLGDALALEMPAMVAGLAHRLVEVGLPLDRFSISFGLLNPQLLAAGFIWRPEQDLEYSRYDYARRDSGIYERSPFKRAHETNTPVHLDLANTADDAFDVVPDLKAEGIAHYYAIPVPTHGASLMALTMATRQAANFSAEAQALVQQILPALAAVVEIKRLRFTLREVLSAYVGRGPARQIIDGSVHRGEVTEVRAAILVADLRGFTHLSTQLPPEATADVINRYYDIVVPPIEARGGEVLKFIGDAVLAIFPADTLGEDGAVLAALDAARDALNTDVPAFVSDASRFEIKFGAAVHVGGAAFGNVGSGDRLDFTMIGRDVNVAARIASLCNRLGRDYLVSEPVAAIGRRHGRIMTDAGAHEVRGLENPVTVFVPDTADIGEEEDDGVSQGLLLAPTL